MAQNRLATRITLVAPPFDDKRDRSAYYVAPPLGLLYIAAFLEHAGYHVSILDFVYEVASGDLKQGPEIYNHCAYRIIETKTGYCRI